MVKEVWEKKNSTFPCRNLERNQLSGPIPAELLARSENGLLSLRYDFCHRPYTLFYYNFRNTAFSAPNYQVCNVSKIII
jgi:hypothetical protein